MAHARISERHPDGRVLTAEVGYTTDSPDALTDAAARVADLWVTIAPGDDEDADE